MQLRESNPKQFSCKKKHVALKKAIVKKMKSSGCDGRLMAKILIPTIQVYLVPNPSEMWRRQHNELSLLKFLLIFYHHSHFLAAILDFTSFFSQ